MLPTTPLTLAFYDGKRRFQLRRPGGGQLALDTVGAWWRRPSAFGLPETRCVPAHRRLAPSEAYTEFHRLYASMDAPSINQPRLDAVASHHLPDAVAEKLRRFDARVRAGVRRA